MATVKKALVILSLSKDQLPEQVTLPGLLETGKAALVNAITLRGLILRQAQDDGVFLRNFVPFQPATALLKMLYPVQKRSLFPFQKAGRQGNQ